MNAATVPALCSGELLDLVHAVHLEEQRHGVDAPALGLVEEVQDLALGEARPYVVALPGGSGDRLQGLGRVVIA